MMMFFSIITIVLKKITSYLKKAQRKMNFVDWSLDLIIKKQNNNLIFY